MRQTDARSHGHKDGFSVSEWRSRLRIPPTWLPLSLAPSLSFSALLRFSAYACLFFAVFGYPFSGGVAEEERFYSLVLVAVLTVGVLVASLGLLELVYWNGRILWLFVPQDWGRPMVGTLSRATGPFVDPDHFANYLAMVFPLDVVGCLYGLQVGRKIYTALVRLACGFCALVIFLAILLSLSRAAWIEAVATLVTVSLLWIRSCLAKSEEAGPDLAPRWLSKLSDAWRAKQHQGARSRLIPHTGRTILISEMLVAATLSVVVAFFILGSQNLAQADARAGQTIVENGGIGIRPAVWKATLVMFRDFPALGVGLASWPEIFPRYEAGPWNANYFREAHNDYLQYLSETGLVGVVLAALFFGMVVTWLFASRSVLEKDWPVFIALVLALGAMAFHELVDFSLRIPANALLFTLFLALALRIATKPNAREDVTTVRRPDVSRAPVVGLIVVSVMLIALALGENGLAYPYDIPMAATPKQALEILLNHPASARAHLAWLALAGPNVTENMRLDEIASAVWLDPIDPSIHDLSAKMLVRAGRTKDGLEQIRESVFNSPTFATHFYLARQMIPWLLPSEQRAIEQGFKAAIAARYPGAVDGLGSFYEAFGRFSDESQLYADAAAKTPIRNERAGYLVAAARAEIKGGNMKVAEVVFRQAIRSAPSDADSYAELVTQIYGPEKNLSAATLMTKQGISNGAEPAPLYMALSSAAEMAGNEVTAEKSLLKALRCDPSFRTVMQVGQFYLRSGHFDQAVSMLQNAVEISPSSAEAFYLLGVAQERSYQYSEADKTYARAAAIAPQQFQPVYAAFRRRMGTAQIKG